jgi:hypothetical protein
VESVSLDEDHGLRIFIRGGSWSVSTIKFAKKYATIASHVTAFTRFDNSAVRHALSPWTASGRAALDQVIQTQASIISYIDDFKLMMILSLAAIPLSASCQRHLATTAM